MLLLLLFFFFFYFFFWGGGFGNIALQIREGRETFLLLKKRPNYPQQGCSHKNTRCQTNCGGTFLKIATKYLWGLNRVSRVIG